MSKIIEVKFCGPVELGNKMVIRKLEINDDLFLERMGKIINIEFVNDNAKSGDYAVRIETDKGYFAVIPNPVMVIGKKSEAKHDD